MNIQKYGSGSLPATPDALVASIKGAMVNIGSGGGGGGAYPYLKIDHQTGAVTFGRDAAPFPLSHKLAIPVASIASGYSIWSGGKVVEEVLAPVASQPIAPTPATPFVGFGEDGPRKVTRLDLHSLNELGLAVTFSSMGISHDNRIRSLLGDFVAQVSANGSKFPNPVIYLSPSHYAWKGKTIWHFNCELLDWIASDGLTLQSKVVGHTADELPWDDGSDDGPGEVL